MAKFNPIQLSKTEDKKGFSFQCPACKCAHFIQTNPLFRPCCGFNGDVNNPTVTPSIKVNLGSGGVCHSFVTEGMIKYCTDCTHDMAGQTVELPEWD